MLPQGLKKAVTDNPKKVAELIDLVNLPTVLRDFMGQSQSSQLSCFRRVWSYVKENNLQVTYATSCYVIVLACVLIALYVCVMLYRIQWIRMLWIVIKSWRAFSWASLRSILLNFPCWSSYTFRSNANDKL